MNVRAIILLACALSMLSCELLNKDNPLATVPAVKMPKVNLEETVLVAAPTATQIAAWYCPQYNPDPTGLTCALLGPVPQKHQMQFHFELRYSIDNPNEIPIPTTEILGVIDVFQGQQKEATLGAVCAVLCNEGDAACTGQPGENSCKASESDIETIDDVVERLEDLLILTIDAAINGELENLAVRMIPAGAKAFEVRVRFSLGVDAMINLMVGLTDQLVSDLLAGSDIQFEIPFAVRGTLWFDIPILGRVALGYGPFEDVWVLEP